MKYKPAKDGEWIRLDQAFHKIRCCDCSLVHLFEFRTVRGQIKFRAWRDPRATSQCRRKGTVKWQPTSPT
jgi:hypothetical protein